MCRCWCDVISFSFAPKKFGGRPFLARAVGGVFLLSSLALREERLRKFTSSTSPWEERVFVSSNPNIITENSYLYTYGSPNFCKLKFTWFRVTMIYGACSTKYCWGFQRSCFGCQTRKISPSRIIMNTPTLELQCFALQWVPNAFINQSPLRIPFHLTQRLINPTTEAHYVKLDWSIKPFVEFWVVYPNIGLEIRHWWSRCASIEHCRPGHCSPCNFRLVLGMVCCAELDAFI